MCIPSNPIYGLQKLVIAPTRPARSSDVGVTIQQDSRLCGSCACHAHPSNVFFTSHIMRTCIQQDLVSLVSDCAGQARSSDKGFTIERLCTTVSVHVWTS
jgi:hypothetical protein